MIDKWDDRFLGLAQHVAGWSKDPSTKVGAVIAGDDHIVRGLGYNGFPRGVPDTPANYENREIKYDRIIHAEMNAVLNASGPVAGCTLYGWPLPPCIRCAAFIIQAGIKRVVAPEYTDGRWKDSCSKAFYLCRDAGVEWKLK